ncbi:MAG: hypothetical protein AAF264_04570, partial [Pseudomonadota bacterium]
LGDGDTKCGEAVENGDADFRLGSLTIEVSGHQLLSDGLYAGRPLAGKALRSNVPRCLVSAWLRR